MTRDAVIRAAQMVNADTGDGHDAFLAALTAHERAIRAQALEDAARVCDIPPGTDPVWEVIGGEVGAELCKSLASAIRAIAQTKEDSHEWPHRPRVAAARQQAMELK